MKSIFLHAIFCIISGTALVLSSCVKEDPVNTIGFRTTKSDRAQEPFPLFGNGFLVPLETAKALAQGINKMHPKADGEFSQVRDIQVSNWHIIKDDNGVNALYIFNFEGGGFAVISADERHDPICAVTFKGIYESVEVPASLIQWFDVTLKNIRLLRTGEVINTLPARKEWIRLLKDIGKEELLPNLSCCPECPNYPDCIKQRELGCGEPDIFCEDENDSDGDGDNETDDPCGALVIKSNGPLVKTTWGQVCSYNEACPEQSCQNPCVPNNNAVTGCVATSMAQIVRYWSAPSQHQYEYSTMPNHYGNYEVQRLMRDAGMSVSTDYGCSGSGANSNNMPGALIQEFGFGTATRQNYDAGGPYLIIQNVDSGRPVILDGCSVRKPLVFGLFYTTSKCHAWICDGYVSVKNNCYFNLKLHMNWGWDGYFDGWYAYNDWSPGNSNYQYSQDITHNIKL